MYLKYFTTFLILGSARAVEFQIKNNQGGDIWVGVQGNSNKPPLEGGGFVLQAGETKTINSADDWAGRFWARTWCNIGSNHCDSGDCGNKLQCGGNGGAPPVSLVEITLKGSGGNDFYDVSLVDGFNVKCSIEPVGGNGNCQKVACSADINQKCPNDLKLTRSTGQVIGCYSSCTKHPENDAYCCKTTKNCNGGPSAPIFKQSCPQAYSYAYDDATSTFTCKANKYIINFG